MDVKHTKGVKRIKLTKTEQRNLTRPVDDLLALAEYGDADASNAALLLTALAKKYSEPVVVGKGGSDA